MFKKKIILCLFIAFAFTNLKAQVISVDPSSSGGNFLIPNYPGNFTTYYDGFSVIFKSNHLISGPATMNIAGQGVINIANTAGNPLAAGDIKLNQIVMLVYESSGARFQMITTPGNMGGSAALTGGGTANYLTKWQTAATVTTSVMYDDGTNVGIGTSTPGAKLEVIQNPVGTATSTGFYIGGSSTQSSNSIMSIAAQQTQTVGGLSNLIGAQLQPIVAATSGTIGGLYGLVAVPFMNGAGGTVTSAYGGLFRVDNSAGTITNAYGIMISAPMSNTGTTTNRYALATDLAAGNVGIGTPSPTAILSVGSDLNLGSMSSTFKTNAGNLGNSSANELSLASIGFMSSNQTALGIRAYRTSAGTDWNTIAIGFGIDVDNTVRAGGSQLWLHANGNVGIGAALPFGKLSVENSFDQANARANHIYLTDPTNANLKGFIGLNRNSAAGADKEYLSIEAVEETIHWMNIALAAEGGNVGIGTTIPSAKLHISGTSGSTIKIVDGNQAAGKVLTSDATGQGSWQTPAGGVAGSGTLNQVAKFTPNGTTLGDSKIFDNGTIVNIKNSTSFNTSGSSPAALNFVEITQASAASNSVALYALHSGAIVGTGYGLQILKTGASTNNVAGYFSATGATNNYAIIVPSTGGNVGIGITAPGAKLEVDGTSGSTIKIVDGNQAAGKVLTSDATGQGSWQTPAGGGITGGGTANYLTRWATASTVTASVIYDDGTNVGIGTTPTELFHVRKTAAAGVAEKIAMFDVIDGAGSFLKIANHSTADGNFEPKITATQIGSNGPSLTLEGDNNNDASAGEAVVSINAKSNAGTVTTRKLFDVRNNGTIKLIMDASGNVGIGTTTPDLSNSGASHTVLSVVNGSVGNFGSVFAGGNQTGTGGQAVGQFMAVNTANGAADKRAGGMLVVTNGATNSHDLRLYSQNAGALTLGMLIDKSGNVGIGITAPTAFLHIEPTAPGAVSLLRAISIGTGNVGYFEVNNAASPNHAVSGVGNGTSSTIKGISTGTGKAAEFFIIGGGSGNCVVTSTDGAGDGVYASNTGTGRAGRFEINNAANAANALVAVTDGTGPAALLSNTNAGLAVANPVLIVNRVNNSAGAKLVSFQTNGTEQGNITNNGVGLLTYATFTGSHCAFTDEHIPMNMLVSLTGTNKYRDNNPDHEIIYGITETKNENDPAVMGNYFSPSDSLIHLVAAVGNGVMWVVDGGTNLQAGDYLISSSTRGHAVKDTGKYDISYIIARVAEPVDWSKVTETFDGKKHKLISIFYENFTRNNKAEKLAVEMGILKKENASLRSDVEKIKLQLGLESESKK